jgi:hypothetical protein
LDSDGAGWWRCSVSACVGRARGQGLRRRHGHRGRLSARPFPHAYEHHGDFTDDGEIAETLAIDRYTRKFGLGDIFKATQKFAILLACDTAKLLFFLSTIFFPFAN